MRAYSLHVIDSPIYTPSVLVLVAIYGVNIMKVPSYTEASSLIHNLSKGYEMLILLFAGLIPSFTIGYLYFFQDAPLHFENHSVHEAAIGISLLQGGFIAYVTYLCYCHSGEPFLRWLTLGFLGFTLIYAFHGAFTSLSHDHLMMFILYGPASRVVMAACLLTGLMTYGQIEQDTARRPLSYWLTWLCAFLFIDVIVYLLANSTFASLSRWVMEITAIAILLSCLLTIIVRRIRSRLLTFYGLSVLFFTQSSFAFLLGSAWEHMWWLAHVIFATGFIGLSYGVIQAFLATGSYTRVFSQEELLKEIREEKARTDDALAKLRLAHETLEIVAATDELTGAVNRREFESKVLVELARANRNGTPFSMIMIDLDHFKQINDHHGHQAGDEILKELVELIKKTLRPTDLVGRIGGEEFALMLPDTSLESASIMAERLRQLVDTDIASGGDIHLNLTASFGVAQYGPDGNTYESLFKIADKRMYDAKQAGRNQVVAH